MRVVNRKTFLELPEGIFYVKGIPWAFENLCIKGESLPSNDWVYLNMDWAEGADSGEAFDILERSLETGASFKCQESWGRDGFYDNEAIFLIFEIDDLMALRGHLEKSITMLWKMENATERPGGE